MVGREVIRGSLPLYEETKEGLNFPGRSVVRILSFRGSLFCRPQTPWRMIHKSAKGGRVSSFFPRGLLPRTPPRNRSILSIASFRTLVNNGRVISLAKVVGGHRGGRKVPDDKGATATQRWRHTGQMKNSYTQLMRLHEYCIASCGQYVRWWSAHEKLPAARAKGS